VKGESKKHNHALLRFTLRQTICQKSFNRIFVSEWPVDLMLVGWILNPTSLGADWKSALHVVWANKSSGREAVRWAIRLIVDRPDSGANLAMLRNNPVHYLNLALNAFALPGGQLFITAALYNRLETDGQLAAEAGYDLRSMLDVMRILEEASGGGGPPETMSTHPQPANLY